MNDYSDNHYWGMDDFPADRDGHARFADLPDLVRCPRCKQVAIPLAGEREAFICPNVVCKQFRSFRRVA